jgi:transcriptional regulator of acetoin/glycerol metabolism
MEALQRQAWPGNVRELRNVIEHAAIITTGDTLKVPMLGEATTAVPPQTLADVEREHILRTLRAVGGNRAAAARVLAVDRKTLYRKLRLYGLA